MSDILNQIAKLSPEKRELLLRQIKKENADKLQIRIPRQPRDSNLFPLSFAQQRLWFLDQLLPENPFYTESSALRLSGVLNVPVLERSFNEIVQRHETLRTTFNIENGQPVQVIAPTRTQALPILDLRALPQAKRQRETARLAAEEAKRPFDLSKGPLVRTTLLQLDEQEFVLLLTMHHIISDGWSLGIFARELSALYVAFLSGQPSPLPLLPIQYADFAVWQRKWLSGEVLETQLAYWKNQLADLPVLQMPTDYARPADFTFRGDFQDMVLSPSLTTALKTLSKKAHVTLYMTLLAAFKTLLHRYTGQDIIVIGTPIANRNRAEIESLIGFFVNTLVMRTELSGNPTFWKLLSRVRDVALGAYAHQDLPFEKLVEELQPKRDLSRNPLFQVIFQLANTPNSPQNSGSQGLSLLEVKTGTTKFDLGLYIWEGNSGQLGGRFEYSIDLFTPATIQRMVNHFQTLLEGIAANPACRLMELPLLGKQERHQMLVAWNQTHSPYPRESTIVQEFESQAALHSERLALVFEGQQLSYQELNRRANQVAHHLRGLGVGVEDLVGICVERSLEMVVGLLGILKAGGAYVPLDPSYPKARLEYIMRDTKVKLILSQKHLLSSLPEAGPEVVCLDSERNELSNQSGENLGSDITAGNLAYLIYTSGSTGEPKGVAVSHGNVLRLVKGSNYISIQERDVFLQFAPLTFDASTFEIWASLLNGARLVLFSARLPSLSELGQVIKREQVSVLWLTAGLFHQMVEDQLQHLGSVGQLLAGGDVLSPVHVQKALRALPGCRLINGYGPTENTTFSCCYAMSGWEEFGASVPIGKPIANSEVYVLDRHFQPVPVGVPGELYLGGDGLARGYWNSPMLTAAKFVPNPFGEKSRTRLYRTGDLVRYRPDGNLEFLGRLDHQVKIRGYRVELGEIETSLGKHPNVQEVVVIAQESKPHEKRLVAYLVSSPGSQLTTGELRRYLQSRLPEYMIPSAFLFLEALPLTPHGKIDRRALPKLDAERPRLEAVYAEPSTPIEKGLAKIWSRTLGVDKIGIHDNFFELGGDSILSIQIIAQAKNAGIQLSPKHLFQYQTIAELAEVAGRAPAIEAEQSLITGEVLLTPIEHWFFEHNFAEPHHFNQAILLGVAQPLNPHFLESAVHHLASHHDVLRLRFEQQAQTWKQFCADSEEAPLFLRMDLSNFSEQKQKEIIEAKSAELQPRLNLSTGPLLQVALFECGPAKPSRLLFIIHHLAVDSVSWQIILEDLWTLYMQLAHGKTVQLPLKTTSFKYWAEKLSQYAQSAAIQNEFNYWISLLDAPIRPMPTDYTSGTNTEASTQTVTISLDREQTRLLLQEVPEAYHTQINDVLLTALAQAFRKWTGKSTLYVDLEGHGREDIFDDVDLSRTVGWFTTIFPVLLDLDGISQPKEALLGVKEQLRKIPNRGIGYGLLRYLSHNEEYATKLKRLPHAEVSFNYLGQFGMSVSNDSIISAVDEWSGPMRSLKNQRSHMLEIDGGVADGQLRFDWRYSQNIHRRSTIQELATDFVQMLQLLIAHCQSIEAGGYTPSDFPKAKISQKDLDQVIKKISQRKGRGSL